MRARPHNFVAALVAAIATIIVAVPILLWAVSLTDVLRNERWWQKAVRYRAWLQSLREVGIPVPPIRMLYSRLFIADLASFFGLFATALLAIYLTATRTYRWAKPLLRAIDGEPVPHAFRQ